jgi:cyanobactin maturation PatA/PatG family protease
MQDYTTINPCLTPAQLVTASATLVDISSPSPTSLTPSTITPSAVSNKVYALGTLGYDFGTEARRDTFKQRMPAVSINGVLVPANPYDARQMVDYLELNPAESKSLIWTLNQELTPIYALEPQKAFANEIYAVFQMLLAGQIQPAESDDYIERVSIPGSLSDRTVELFSGQVVPVLALPNIRGMYGWQVNPLVEAAVTTVSPEASEPDSVSMRRSLKSFLHRIYYDLRNLGQLDRDRALNFAATNAFQAASTFESAIVSGMELDSIEVEKSPFCRLNSNCWDIKLKFFDPENSRRSKKVYRFTIDVANIMPVTLGTVRSWSVPR